MHDVIQGPEMTLHIEVVGLQNSCSGGLDGRGGVYTVTIPSLYICILWDW